jgi:hypothetical protein
MTLRSARPIVVPIATITRGLDNMKPSFLQLPREAIVASSISGPLATEGT